MKYTSWIVSLVAAVMLTASGCTQTSPSPAPPAGTTAAGKAKAFANVTPEEFKKAMDSGADITILDVRTLEEYNEGHVAGCVNIDWYSDTFKNEAAKLDKNKPVYVYCAVGGRSGKATELLKSMGFAEVHNLTGGMDAWRAGGFPVE